MKKVIYIYWAQKFIHICKCGGTSISKESNLSEYHLNRNYKNNENYINKHVSLFFFFYTCIFI